jgi:hypothetical protein
MVDSPARRLPSAFRRLRARHAIALGLLMTLIAAAPARAEQPPYRSSIERLDDETKALMKGASWHPGCPVALHELRLVHMRIWGFDHASHAGQFVVKRRWAHDMAKVFRHLYNARFPIRRMRLMDHYGADDDKSMKADNTSAFNCRFVAGTTTWSQHACGRAIDINPVENPFVDGNHVSPPNGKKYANRALHRRGMIHLHDVVWHAFDNIGWGWGGTWSGAQDYQHFSSTGT